MDNNEEIMELKKCYKEVLKELTNQMQRIMSVNKKLQDLSGEKDIHDTQIREINDRLTDLNTIEENLRNNNVILDRICERLQGLDNVEENLRNNNAELEKSGESICEINKRLNNFNAIEENLRNNNIRIDRTCERLHDLDTAKVNLRNNNEQLEKINLSIQKLETQVSLLKKKVNGTESSEQFQETSNSLNASVAPKPRTSDVSYSIDYFDFENHFRGSRTQIMKTQEQYIKYFKGAGKVVDLGSGRGEFLELLKENHICAVGVDIYDEFIEFCRQRGLDVIQQDAIEYLRKQKSVDGIFAGQLIEHIPIESIIELCVLAYEKLKIGSYMILETPNPMSLSIFTHSFYMDPSHIKPVHPLTLKYIVEKAGFKDVKILFTENSKFPITVPELKIEGVDNLDEFNKSMQEISETLFGSQDYAVIAKR